MHGLRVGAGKGASVTIAYDGLGTSTLDDKSLAVAHIGTGHGGYVSIRISHSFTRCEKTQSPQTGIP